MDSEAAFLAWLTECGDGPSGLGSQQIFEAGFRAGLASQL